MPIVYTILLLVSVIFSAIHIEKVLFGNEAVARHGAFSVLGLIGTGVCFMLLLAYLF